MDIQDHRVLYSLDRPFRIFTWTVPEFGCIASPIVVGFLLDELFIGVIAAGLLYTGYAKFLKRIGLMSSWMYWVCPLSPSTHIPPSWIRIVGR